MKICVFHNLKPGGALNKAKEIIKVLSTNNEIHIYSHNEHLKAANCKYHIHQISHANNIIEHLYQAIFVLNKSQKLMADSINSNRFDLILVFPCIITQSPFILKHINKNHIYVFTEPKREFYENTNYDHFTIRKILTRLIRYPIKTIDKMNCKKAVNIVTNSYYSNHILKKIYNKNGHVIYPGLAKNKPYKLIKLNNGKVISIGQISKIKGHDFSIKQLSNSGIILNVIGRKTDDKKYLVKLSNNVKTIINFIETENETEKIKLLKKHSIYLANQLKEPFGISTLEACDNSRLVIGKNEGGTPEIISHGLNGYIYPNSINTSRYIINKYTKKDVLTFYKTSHISWKQTTESLLRFYHFIKNEPNE